MSLLRWRREKARGGEGQPTTKVKALEKVVENELGNRTEMETNEMENNTM